MEAKVTRKWIASNFTCCGVGYCALQYLLWFQSKKFYTTGVYGWNFDAYTFGTCCITTGYRNMIHHVEVEAENVKEYENKAMEIIKDSSLSYEEQKNKVNALLKQFLEKTFNADFSIYVY